jgi:hypothetical protein
VRSIALLDRRSDLRHAGAGTVQLHRVTRDIQADCSRHAVRFPRRPPVGVTTLDEAVVVVLVSRVLASAETGDVMQHFRMSRGERIHRANDLWRSGRCIRSDGKRRQFSRVRRRRWCKWDGLRSRSLSNGRGGCRRLRLRSA